MGHTPGDAATCTEAQVCTVCGEILAAALGHTPGDAATCTEAQVCTVCGETLAAALGHTPGDAATCTEAQVCTVCGEVLAAAFGHDYENGVCTICGAADPAHIELPVTGETNRFALLSMILMTMATLLYAVKRRLRSTK
jgi:LPXTG-motif cell wall-anchored protein